MSDNFNKLKHVFIRNWKSIFESIPLSIAIIVSFYTIMVEDITTKTQEELFSYIIMILGLLAFATLIERFLSLKEITQLCKETNDYLIEREMKPNLDSIIFDQKSLPPLEDRLRSATDIAITGGSLFRLADSYSNFFEQKAKEGCLIKFLMLKPGCDASKLVAEYVVYETSTSDYEVQLRTALKKLYRLKQHYPDQVEIKTYECVPPFSLLICDPKKETGSIMVELYTHAIPNRDRPEFIIHAREHRLHKLFLEQFNKMWGEAIPWEPS